MKNEAEYIALLRRAKEMLDEISFLVGVDSAVCKDIDAYLATVDRLTGREYKPDITL